MGSLPDLTVSAIILHERIQALKFEIGDSEDGDDGDYYPADETLPRFPNDKNYRN